MIFVPKIKCSKKRKVFTFTIGCALTCATSEKASVHERALSSDKEIELAERILNKTVF